MQLDNNFFKINSKVSPKQGRLIISEPFLPGDYFNRSAVLLTECSEGGAIGFILNKPIDFPVHEFFDEFSDFKANIYAGGPVSTNVIYFIHTLGDKLKDSIPIMDNLYWGGDFETLMSLVKDKKVQSNQIRFFLGYAGWGKGQLENEILENSWLVMETNAKMVMGSSHDFWSDCMDKIGGKCTLWKNFPENPDWN